MQRREFIGLIGVAATPDRAPCGGVSVASLDVRWDRDAECEYCPIAARRSQSCDL